MPQPHLENQAVVLFGAVRIQEIQNTTSVGANTLTVEETDSKIINHEHQFRNASNKPINPSF